MIAPNTLTSLSAWFDGRNGGSAGSFVGYFPDFALTVLPSVHSINGINDSDFSYCRVPSVKLYTDKVKFTSVVTPTPSNGTITVNFLNKSTPALQDSLTTYPDSLRVRIRCTGGVTSGSYNVAVYGRGSNGTPVHLRNISLSVLTGISHYNNEVPNSFYLYQNFPNPFNPTTNIRFDIAKGGHVKIVVFDATGKQVAELVNGQYSTGKYIADFDAKELSSGIYFYKIETAGFVDVKKMMLIK
jgi:hypothetical protein